MKPSTKLLTLVSKNLLRHALNGDVLHKAFYLPQLPANITHVVVWAAVMRHFSTTTGAGVDFDTQLAKNLEFYADHGQRIGIRAGLTDPTVLVELSERAAQHWE